MIWPQHQDPDVFGGCLGSSRAGAAVDFMVIQSPWHLPRNVKGNTKGQRPLKIDNTTVGSKIATGCMD